ncbi:methyl-accepting chemotaxis protein [Meiothermus taiwanensis]|uniref:Methyl-accepting chemotaxis protein 4 n=2 Tax=Meiothermus taiwanensis TaxID=172827 RepID=A0A399DUS3_9DEIN|nr:methyl-accepting chemotaxis protein [Meiothermus taiwanensis]AWR85908.1 methyl-accepting chemotaxis sensory transducer [Meiothermus taiwanensis WR-220]KIQ54661.1 chemotaxis protein [Meiothermus taiwanensis]KZK15504.1 chemotaxis protein [Meiothermus taiwanensis]RIH75817.1 Methyl-accepting chemotaxis protein 4 [Meiothermus taiwanensis]
MALQRELREVEIKQVGLLGAHSRKVRVDAEALEAPYTGFFGNLRVPYKLALLVVPLLLPIFYLLFALMFEQRNDINFVRAEKQGVLFLQSTGSLIKAMAEHRNMSTATLSGNQELVLPRSQKAEEISRSLQLLDRLNRTEGDPYGVGERLAAIRTNWDTLLAVRYSPAQSFQAHTQLIGQLLELYEQMAIGSNLILDPTVQSYWLVDSVVYRLPPVMETLSQIQGIGVAALQSKQLTAEQERRLSGLLASLVNRGTGFGEVASVTAALERSVQNALATNPSLSESLQEQVGTARAITESAVELTRREVLSRRFSLEPAFYFDQLSRPIEAYFTVQTAALNQLNNLLDNRLGQLVNRQVLSLFIVVATLMLSLWLIIGVLRSILAPVQELTRVAQHIGQGNLSTLAHLRSNDELGLVSRTLNQSILTLRTLLEQQEAERQRGLRLQENVQRFLDVATKIAQGDLTERGEVTDDVLGNVVDAVNLTVEEIAHLLKEVKQAAESVSQSAMQMDQLTASIASGALLQAQEVSQVQQQTQIAAKNIRQMAQSASITAEAALRTLESAQLGRQAVTQTLSGMSDIRREMQAIAENIAALAARSAEIESITRVLEDFASQTNLLALNAAFEAAGAGAAGRRFAIVAEEIRKLAEDSARETSRVNNLVQQVQADISRVVELVREGVREVETGYDTANSAGSRLEEIARLAEQSASLAQEISGLAQNQVAVVERVDQAVQKITQTAQKTGIESQEGRQSAEAMRVLAQELSRSLGRFRLPD